MGEEQHIFLCDECKKLLERNPNQKVPVIRCVVKLKQSIAPPCRWLFRYARFIEIKHFNDMTNEVTPLNECPK